MKVRRFVLCILLSLTLVVTFIPVMSFAAPSNGQHAVTFEGIGSFVLGGDGKYYAYPEHGEIYASDKHSQLYSETDKCFYFTEDQDFQFRVLANEGWIIDAIEYTYDNGVTYEAVSEYADNWYGFYLPSGDVPYDAVQVRVSYAQDPNYVIHSIDLSVKAPVCGTVVKDNYIVTEPQPEITIPEGSKYALNVYKGYDNTWWYDPTNDTWDFTVKGGNTYTASIVLQSKNELTVFADKPTLNISGGKVEFTNNLDDIYRLDVDVQAVHDWKWETTKAGLLKNGTKQQRCTACGAVQKKTVTPGWATSYVKGMKVSKGKGKITVKWTKQSKANLKKFNGYQIRYSTKTNMAGAKTVAAGKTAKSKTIKKLGKKTTYYVQMRTYTKTTAGTFYSGWSKAKKVKTK